jgi:hypothetical protein
MIGGMVSSTLLTLLVIPALYAMTRRFPSEPASVEVSTPTTEPFVMGAVKPHETTYCDTVVDR